MTSISGLKKSVILLSQSPRFASSHRYSHMLFSLLFFLAAPDHTKQVDVWQKNKGSPVRSMSWGPWGIFCWCNRLFNARISHTIYGQFSCSLWWFAVLKIALRLRATIQRAFFNRMKFNLYCYPPHFTSRAPWIGLFLMFHALGDGFFNERSIM